MKTDAANKAALDGIERIKEQAAGAAPAPVTIEKPAAFEPADVDRMRSEKIRRLLEEAEKSFSDGSHEKAQKQYEKVLKLDQENAAAIKGLSSIEAYKEEIIKERERIETLKRRKERDLLLKRREKEAEKLRKAAEKKQGEIDAILQRAERAFEKGSCKKAVKYYEKVLKIDDGNTIASEGLERIREDEALLPAEKKHRQSDVSGDEGKSRAAAEKVLSKEEEKKLKEAEKKRKKIARLQKKASEYMAKNKYRKAQKYFKEIISIDINNKAAWNGLREVNRREELLLKEKEKDRRSDQDRTLKKKIAALLEDAEKAMAETRYAMAERYYNEVLILDEHNGEAQKGMAEIEKIYESYDDELQGPEQPETDTEQREEGAAAEASEKDIRAGMMTIYLALNRKGYEAVSHIVNDLLNEYGDNPLLVQELAALVQTIDNEMKKARGNRNRAIMEELLILRRRVYNDCKSVFEKSDAALGVTGSLDSDSAAVADDGIASPAESGSPVQQTHVSSLLRSADSALEEGYFELASSLYNRVLSIRKNDEQALAGLRKIENFKKRYIEQKSERQKEFERRIRKDSYQRDLIGSGRLTESQLAGQVDDLLGEAREALAEGNIVLAKGFFEHIVFIALENPGLFERRLSLRKEINGLSEAIRIAEEKESARIEKVLEGTL